jgi:pimeloyl-ACP methyl ester carboxylesterase
MPVFDRRSEGRAITGDPAGRAARCAGVVLLLLMVLTLPVFAETTTSSSARPADAVTRAGTLLSMAQAAPGTLLRSEQLSGAPVPQGGQAWRIEYATSAPDGSAANAVATVLASANRPAGPMPVIAWTHGAVGLVQRCLPSATDPWKEIPALDEVVARGWIVVATDYQVNSDGVHPFLIGEGEARSTLDAVRAVRQMPDLRVDNRTVVWGHSQGGHAALWTGIIGPTYAPDLPISGIVAISPVTGLVSLLNRQGESSVAPILGSWLAAAYSSYYPDVDYGSIVTTTAQEAGKELAQRCPSDPLDGIATGLILRDLGDEPLLVVPPPDSFRNRLLENEPDGPIAAPVVIAQGLADVIVVPQVTAGFVAARCAAGDAISYWQLPGQDHLGLVQPGSPVEDPLITWTAERFAGNAPVGTCTETTIGG